MNTGLTKHPENGYAIVVCDSLEKVYGTDEPRAHALGRVVLPRAGVGSFQVAVLPSSSWHAGRDGVAIPTVTAPGGVSVTPHAVDFVPCSMTATAARDDRYDHTGPALLPDVLRPLGQGEGLPLVQAQWRSLWVSVEAGDEVCDGEVIVEIRTEHTGVAIGRVAVPVTVLDVALPPIPITCTQWLHVDSLAQYYGVEPYSSRGWELIERFAAAVVDSGSTALLTPIHTPPLDTAVGSRRMDVALVGVRRTGSGYEFDTTKLERWIEMCKRVGVRELEMAHLFTQWGGEHAPAIADADGELIFGWHTDSLGDEYQTFLRSYIPAVRRVLDEQWGGPVFWHLTDEPSGEHARRYSELKESVASLLEGEVITDALSDVELWSTGLVDPPIVATDHAQAFVDQGLERPWLYYCTQQSVDAANRFIGMPSYRNRVLGWQLYAYGASGFLHWGFNFWNTQLSRRALDPFSDTCSGGGFQAGDAFVVYPGDGGVPWQSIRLAVFREAMDDLRLFTALVERDGREAVAELLELEGLTLVDYPNDPAFYLRGHERALRALAGDRAFRGSPKSGSGSRYCSSMTEAKGMKLR